MSWIYSVFMIMMLVCSFLGHMILARKVIGLQKEFIPGFVFASIACIIYGSGLFGVLYTASIIIMVSGVIALCVLLIDMFKKKSGVKISFSLFGFFWIIGCLFFFFILFNNKLIHYDNFSHWAIVVKQMLSTNSFPTVESNLIEFKNYPLGISSFIYYICLFAGREQSIMIVAQGMLIFSCFYAMFGIISEKKRFLLYAILGLGLASLSFFNITIRINNLLVDFLLPIYTLAIIAIVHQNSTDIKRACIGVLPMAGLLTVTKSTGIIFASIGLIFLFYIVFLNIRNNTKWRLLIFPIITSFVSVLPYFGWLWHVNRAFSNIDKKFDLQNMPIEKTAEQIKEISTQFFRTSIDISTRPALGILVFNVVAISAIVFNLLFLKKRWKLWKTLITLDILLILYYVGILGLYIFSMPLDEAIWLAGFERYASSIVVFFAGGLVFTAVLDVENSFYYKIGAVPDEQAFKSVANKEIYQKGVLACMAIAVTLLISEYNGIAAIAHGYETTLPYKIQEITGDRWYEDGKEDDNKYIFYASDKDSQVTNFYMQYVGRYFLYSRNVDGICLFYEDNMDALLSKYDYLVVVESDDNERDLLRKHYNISGQESIYKVISEDGRITLVEVEK